MKKGAGESLAVPLETLLRKNSAYIFFDLALMLVAVFTPSFVV
jgi:hypothetical protein